MSLQKPVPLGEVYSELSCIHFAAREEFSGIGGMPDIEISYHDQIGIQLKIGVWGTAEQKKRLTELVVLRLQRGIIWGEYDYRFRGVSYGTHYDESYKPHWILATLDLQHWPHRRPRGWEPPLSPSERSYSSGRVLAPATPRHHLENRH